jgi:predicted Fe-Mo cluster-binding NifX family protein
MKKIAAACMGDQISQHFGHCEIFILFETDGGRVLSEENVQNPGHKPGFLPNFLGDKGVKVVIAGGIGGGAIEIFNERGIAVVTGAQGNARTAVDAYLAGTLKSTNAECHEHAHAGGCGNHQ